MVTTRWRDVAWRSLLGLLSLLLGAFRPVADAVVVEPAAVVPVATRVRRLVAQLTAVVRGSRAPPAATCA